MGQKVHPEAMRVGYIHDWKATWFNEKEFADYLAEDIEIRKHIIDRLSHAGISKITIKKNTIMPLPPEFMNFEEFSTVFTGIMWCSARPLRRSPTGLVTFHSPAD
jgi:hypothetical protein